MAHLVAVAPNAVLPRVQRVWVERGRGCRRHHRRVGGVIIRAEHAKREGTLVSRVPRPAGPRGGEGEVGL